MKRTKRELDKLVKNINDDLRMGVVCDRINRCVGWEKSMPQIIDAQRLLFITKGIDYTGDKFKVCPWCGKKITWSTNSALASKI